MTAALTIAGLTAGYGVTRIVEDVSIDVADRQIVVIVGPNGAGKSTVLKSIFGLTRIFGGDIRFQDRTITGWPSDRLVPAGVAAVPQVRNVFPSLSVAENLDIGTYAVAGGDIRAQRDHVLSLFPDLRPKLRQPAGELSGGQRQMVAIGRALMSRPRLLLLDEPTAGLSPAYMDVIFDLVLAIRASGVAVLMVEQNARQALGIADHAYVLAGGRNFRQGSGRDLLADREVHLSFLGGRDQP